MLSLQQKTNNSLWNLSESPFWEKQCCCSQNGLLSSGHCTSVVKHCIQSRCSNRFVFLHWLIVRSVSSLHSKLLLGTTDSFLSVWPKIITFQFYAACSALLRQATAGHSSDTFRHRHQTWEDHHLLVIRFHQHRRSVFVDMCDGHNQCCGIETFCLYNSVSTALKPPGGTAWGKCSSSWFFFFMLFYQKGPIDTKNLFYKGVLAKT